MENIFYFGTDLNNAGHYFWKLNKNGINEISRHSVQTPFNPEFITDHLRYGEDIFYNVHLPERKHDVTIYAINAAPGDKRSGSHSIFWVNKKIETVDEFKDILKEYDFFVQLVQKIFIASKK